MAVFEEGNLHHELVRTIVRIVLLLDQKQKEGVESFSMKEFWDICQREDNRHEDTGMYAFEFVKDGVISLRAEHIEQVVNGDYTWVWQSVRGYFRLKELEPVPVVP